MAEAGRQTPFERITQAVRAQIPLVRAMEAELGRERAHQLVREALDKANRKAVAARGSLLDIPTLAAEFASFGTGRPRASGISRVLCRVCAAHGP